MKPITDPAMPALIVAVFLAVLFVMTMWLWSENVALEERVATLERNVVYESIWMK